MAEYFEAVRKYRKLQLLEISTKEIKRDMFWKRALEEAIFRNHINRETQLRSIRNRGRYQCGKFYPNFMYVLFPTKAEKSHSLRGRNENDAYIKILTIPVTSSPRNTLRKFSFVQVSMLQSFRKAVIALSTNNQSLCQFGNFTVCVPVCIR